MLLRINKLIFQNWLIIFQKNRINQDLGLISAIDLKRLMNLNLPFPRVYTKQCVRVFPVYTTKSYLSHLSRRWRFVFSGQLRPLIQNLITYSCSSRLNTSIHIQNKWFCFQNLKPRIPSFLIILNSVQFRCCFGWFVLFLCYSSDSISHISKFPWFAFKDSIFWFVWEFHPLVFLILKFQRPLILLCCANVFHFLIVEVPSTIDVACLNYGLIRSLHFRLHLNPISFTVFDAYMIWLMLLYDLVICMCMYMIWLIVDIHLEHVIFIVSVLNG